MEVDLTILSFIKDIKNGEHPVCKAKIKPLLNVHCLKLDITTILEFLIGKILKRNNLTFKKPLSVSLKGIPKRKNRSKKDYLQDIKLNIRVRLFK